MENITFSLNEDCFFTGANEMAANEMAIANEMASNEMAIANEMNVYYQSNYNVKELNHILYYYGINKSKMVKDEMIQVLLFFETDPENLDKVMHRRRLWQNITELKTDAYLGKYILW